MRTTVTLDDDLVARAQELTGRSEVSAIVRMSMELLVQLESGRRLAQLGGTDPGAEGGRRCPQALRLRTRHRRCSPAGFGDTPARQHNLDP